MDGGGSVNQKMGPRHERVQVFKFKSRGAAYIQEGAIHIIADGVVVH